MKNHKNLNFEQKMRSFSLTLFLRFTLIASLLCGTLLTLYICNFTITLVHSNVLNEAQSIERSLFTYQRIINAISVDNTVQKYYNSYSTTEIPAYKLTEVLSTYLNEDINFISIVTPEHETAIVRNRLLFDNNLTEHLITDYENSSIISSRLRLLPNTTYYSNADEILLFFPLYSTTTLNKELGMICINVNKSSILPTEYPDNISTSFYFTDKDGKILDISHSSKNDSKKAELQKAQALPVTKDINIQIDGIYLFTKVHNYDCYFANKISFNHLLGSGINVSIIISIIFTFLILSMLRSIHLIISNAYKPWIHVINSMKLVVNGELDTRIHFDDSDIDMQTVSDGFNLMLDQINHLMAQYKNEQYRLAEAEFTILQSQIQPHFLYNTLECIHWQSVTDESSCVSPMIKTLANYYRTILSKGKNIISWKDELALTTNYLILQKMRFDDSLHYLIDCDVALDTIYLPKLTLQPLVENAINHALNIENNNSLQIVIRGRKTQTGYLLSVIDDGENMTQELIDVINTSIITEDESFGFGIQNVNYRLKHFWNNEFNLTYHLTPGGGTTVAINLISSD